MRIVVTGSSGFIGSALVEALTARGDDVVSLVRRPPPGTPAALAGHRSEARWDPVAGTLEMDVLEDAEAVVHLAGAGIGDRRWSAGRKELLRQSRIDSTALLANTLAASARRPAVFVCASAIGYYGDRDTEVLTEDSSSGTGFLAELCRDWEGAAGPAREAGVRVVHLRSGIVLAKSGGALARQLLLFRLGLGGRLGTGRQWLSWITLADEIRAVLHCLDTPTVDGAVNLVAPTPVTNADFTRALAHTLRRPALLAVPESLLAALLGHEMVREVLLASQRALPERLLQSGFSFHHGDLDAGLRAALAS